MPNEHLDRSVIYDLNTNKHALLSNIELRTMNKENNSDAGLRIIESEVELEERRILGGDSLIGRDRYSHDD